MKVSVENLEGSMAKITVTVPSDQFTKAVTDSFNKNKARYEVQGFRKGHAPQAMIEKLYGEGVFFEDAINSCIDQTYGDAMKESGLDIVSKAKFDLDDFGKGKDLVYTAEVAVRPEVKLGKYKGLKLEAVDEKVTAAEVDAAIKQEQERNSRLITVERAAKNSDTVVIDFDGSVDGVHFEGGKAEDYSLVLGSHSFIDNFEDQICGHKAGESFDVHVTFPAEYNAANLAGKAAVFAIVLKEVKEKELPEINDEFASEVSEFDTLKEYKADLKAKLQEEKSKTAEVKKENAVVDKVSEACKVELPELMVETRIDDTINNYAREMQAQGVKFEDYMKYAGLTMEQLREQIKPQAEKELTMSLALEAIANKEKVMVSDEAVDEELKKMAESYRMTVEKLQELLPEEERENIRQDLRIRETVKLLVKESVFEKAEKAAKAKADPAEKPAKETKTTKAAKTTTTTKSTKTVKADK